MLRRLADEEGKHRRYVSLDLLGPRTLAIENPALFMQRYQAPLLIIAEDGELFPIEVKLSATPTVRDVRGISALQKKGAPLGKGMVACMVDEPFPLTADVEAMPPDIVW